MRKISVLLFAFLGCLTQVQNVSGIEKNNIVRIEEALA